MIREPGDRLTTGHIDRYCGKRWLARVVVLHEAGLSTAFLKEPLSTAVNLRPTLPHPFAGRKGCEKRVKHDRLQPLRRPDNPYKKRRNNDCSGCRPFGAAPQVARRTTLDTSSTYLEKPFPRGTISQEVYGLAPSVGASIGSRFCSEPPGVALRLTEWHLLAMYWVTALHAEARAEHVPAREEVVRASLDAQPNRPLIICGEGSESFVTSWPSFGDSPGIFVANMNHVGLEVSIEYALDPHIVVYDPDSSEGFRPEISEDGPFDWHFEPGQAFVILSGDAASLHSGEFQTAGAPR